MTAASHETPEPRPTPRWLHAWAIVTALVAFAPLYLGTEVTNKGAGMIDPDGWSHFREPLILVRQWRESGPLMQNLAYVVEHGHRLAGIAIGIS